MMQEDRGGMLRRSGRDGARISSYRKSWALVIGINDYATYHPPLRNAVNDAREVAKLLRFYGFNCQTLVNEEATKDAILGYLRDTLPGQLDVREEDRIVIFFAGHGISQEGKRGYIVPHGAQAAHRDYISMGELREACAPLKSRHILIMLDCCFSGMAAVGTRAGLFQRQPNDDILLQRLISKRAWQLIMAGEQDEPVADSGRNRNHSAFTYWLLQGLSGGADARQDGIITARELENYIATQVYEETKTTSTPQIPFMRYLNEGEEQGDVLFQVPENVPYPWVTDLTQPGDDRSRTAGGAGLAGWLGSGRWRVLLPAAAALFILASVACIAILWVLLANRDGEGLGGLGATAVADTPTFTPTIPPAQEGTVPAIPSGPAAGDDCEPNESFAEACLMGLGDLYALSFEPLVPGSADIDFFRVFVKPGLVYTCQTTDLSSLTDTRLIFYDENQEMIAQNDDAEPGDPRSRLSFEPPFEGFLYLQVESVAPVEPELAAGYTYSLFCTSGLPPTPTGTPAPEATEIVTAPTRTPTPSPSPTPTPTPDPGLIAHYPLTEDGRDVSGRARDMDLQNVVFALDAAYCDGSYDLGNPNGCRIRTPQLDAFDFGSFTIDVMFRVESLQRAPVFMGGTSYRWIGFYLLPDGGLALKYSSQESLECGTLSYQVETWHNAVITYDGRTARLYLDRRLACSIDYVPNHNDQAVIGVTDYSNASVFKGFIRDLRIYDEVRSPVLILRPPILVPEILVTVGPPQFAP
jgi:hypothetical protein